MQVELEPTSWAVQRFGEHAQAVMMGVVQALTDAQRAALAAQDASRLRARHPYGGTWLARYEFLVGALHELPGVQIVRPHGAGYRLVLLNGCLLVPFLHSKTLTEPPISQARVPSVLLRELTAAAVPPPHEPLALFAPDPPATGGARSAVATLPVGTEVVYVAFVANADSDGVLAAWWGIPRFQDSEGGLTWSPDPLPVHLAERGDPDPARDPARFSPVVPAPRRAFDQGELPELALGARPGPTEPPPTSDPAGRDAAGPGGPGTDRADGDGDGDTGSEPGGRRDG